MKAKVVGKDSFISKKSGKSCYMLHCVCERSQTVGHEGMQTLQQFCSEEIYNSIPVNVNVNLCYGFGGYLEGIEVCK